MKQLLLLDGMLVHHPHFQAFLSGFSNSSLVPIYIPEWREALSDYSILPKGWTQTDELTIRPLHLAINTVHMPRPGGNCMWLWRCIIGCYSATTSQGAHLWVLSFEQITAWARNKRIWGCSRSGQSCWSSANIFHWLAFLGFSGVTNKWQK